MSEDIDIGIYLTRIRDGSFDGRFEEILEAMHARREDRREAVLSQVKEVYGPDAEIVIPEEPSPLKRLFEKTEIEQPINPFLEKRKAPRVEEIETESNEEEVAPDALSDLNSEQLASLNQGDEPPIESRGAIIGGLASSDIGE